MFFALIDGLVPPEAYISSRFPAPQNSDELPLQTMLQSVIFVFEAELDTELSHQHSEAYSSPANVYPAEPQAVVQPATDIPAAPPSG